MIRCLILALLLFLPAAADPAPAPTPITWEEPIAGAWRAYRIECPWCRAVSVLVTVRVATAGRLWDRCRNRECMHGGELVWFLAEPWVVGD